MAWPDEIVDSDGSDNGKENTPEPGVAASEQSPPQSVLSHRFRELSDEPTEQPKRGKENGDKKVSVMLAARINPEEYAPYQGDTTVDTILEEVDGPDDERWFRIEYEDGLEDKVSGILVYWRSVISFKYKEHASRASLSDFCMQDRCVAIKLHLMISHCCHCYKSFYLDLERKTDG